MPHLYYPYGVRPCGTDAVMRKALAMEKAVFLDRDGTINEDVGYVHKIEDFKFLPGALEGLKILQDAGYLLIIITNQSGIARGYFSEQEYQVLERYMLGKFQESGIRVAGSYYCPHHPEGKVSGYRCVCSCRKPEVGLFIHAAKEYGIDFSQSFAIGDRLRDLAICEKKPCRGYLVGSKGGHPDESLFEGLSDCLSGSLFRVDASINRKIKIVGSLAEAAKDIVSLG